jgi:predicted ATP-binding protein involved in virulence
MIGGRIVPFDLLSDGERSILGLVADIARRAAILNPQFAEKAALETDGVVLIDEIDQHLHPRWQRKIVGDLRRTFPNVQFIATTHSPFIIQSLRPGELIRLDGDVSDDAQAGSIEDIVEGLMGVEVPQRSQRFQDMMEAARKYYAALNEKRSEEDVKGLRLRLDELLAPFSDDPAFVAQLVEARMASGLDP